MGTFSWDLIRRWLSTPVDAVYLRPSPKVCNPRPRSGGAGREQHAKAPPRRAI